MLEVGPLPSNFILPSILVPFLSTDKDPGLSREVVDVFKIGIVDFTCVIFQVQGNVTYTLGIYDTFMPFTYVSYHLSRVFYYV